LRNFVNYHDEIRLSKMSCIYLNIGVTKNFDGEGAQIGKKILGRYFSGVFW